MFIVWLQGTVSVGVQKVGVILQVTPAGQPVTDRLTCAGVPTNLVTISGWVSEEPWVIILGFRLLKLKSKDVGGVTVRVNEVE